MTPQSKATAAMWTGSAGLLIGLFITFIGFVGTVTTGTPPLWPAIVGLPLIAVGVAGLVTANTLWPKAEEIDEPEYSGEGLA